MATPASSVDRADTGPKSAVEGMAVAMAEDTDPQCEAEKDMVAVVAMVEIDVVEAMVEIDVVEAEDMEADVVGVADMTAVVVGVGEAAEDTGIDVEVASGGVTAEGLEVVVTAADTEVVVMAVATEVVVTEADTEVVVMAVATEVVEADAGAVATEAGVTHRILLLVILHTATSRRIVTVIRAAAGQ